MPEEIAWVMAQRHRPLAVGQALSTIVQAIDTDTIVKTRFDRLISTYTYEFGGCNRYGVWIKKISLVMLQMLIVNMQ